MFKEKLKIVIATIIVINIVSLHNFYAFASENVYGEKQGATNTLTVGEIKNNENSNNTEENNENKENKDKKEVKPLTLEEQQKQVQEHLKLANQQLTYVEAELSVEVVQIAKLEDKIAQYEKELNEINVKYQQIYDEVTASNNRLEEIKDVYKKNDDLLRKRLINIYIRGETSYMDVLLNSADILDFISNYFTIKKIVENDTRKLRKIQEQKQQIEKINNELLEKKANMKMMKVKAESQSVILANTKTVLETHKQSLTDSQKQLVAEIDAYKKQENEINTLIQNRIYTSNYELTYKGGSMLWPTLGTFYVTSPFGSRVHPIKGIVRNHTGMDIAGPGAYGKPIFAAKDGLVIYAGVMGGYGNCVMVDHGLDEKGVKIVTLYGHGSKIVTQVGTQVKQGDIIMEIGSTGYSTGPHVHFEVRENGIPVDPRKYLQG